MEVKRIFEDYNFEEINNDWKINDIIQDAMQNMMNDAYAQITRYLKKNLNDFGFNFDLNNPLCPEFIAYTANITRVEYQNDTKVEYYAIIRGEKTLIGITNENKKSFNTDPETGKITFTMG